MQDEPGGSDEQTAGQWLKTGHESQKRGQDGVCLFTMHSHKVSWESWTARFSQTNQTDQPTETLVRC